MGYSFPHFGQSVLPLLQLYLLRNQISHQMTSSDPSSDSLQIRMHSYPFILSPCFSHHFSFFFILSSTIRIMFYFLSLRKKSSLSSLFPLSKITLQLLSAVSCPDSTLFSVHLRFQNLSVHLFIQLNLQSVLLY